MVVFKSNIISRPSVQGNGRNFIIGGAFCYLDQSEYDRLMADDNIDRLEITDTTEIIPGSAKKDEEDNLIPGSETKTRSIVQFIKKEMTLREKLEEKVALVDLAAKITPEAAKVLESLGI